jgi:hypothetical protein
VAFRLDFVTGAFDAGGETLSGALVCPFFEFLPDLVADGRPVFEAARLAGAFDAAGRAFRAERLPDFLRVFLDIRLPFVAFRGSIIEILKSIVRPAGLTFSDYAQREFDAPPAHWRDLSRVTVEGAGRSASTWGTDTFASAGIEGLSA